MRTFDKSAGRGRSYVFLFIPKYWFKCRRNISKAISQGLSIETKTSFSIEWIEFSSKFWAVWYYFKMSFHGSKLFDDWRSWRLGNIKNISKVTVNPTLDASSIIIIARNTRLVMKAIKLGLYSSYNLLQPSYFRICHPNNTFKQELPRLKFELFCY